MRRSRSLTLRSFLHTILFVYVCFPLLSRSAVGMKNLEAPAILGVALAARAPCFHGARRCYSTETPRATSHKRVRETNGQRRTPRRAHTPPRAWIPRSIPRRRPGTNEIRVVGRKLPRHMYVYGSMEKRHLSRRKWALCISIVRYCLHASFRLSFLSFVGFALFLLGLVCDLSGGSRKN